MTATLSCGNKKSRLFRATSSDVAWKHLTRYIFYVYLSDHFYFFIFNSNAPCNRYNNGLNFNLDDLIAYNLNGTCLSNRKNPNILRF